MVAVYGRCAYQRRIQNPVKYLRWRFLRKYFLVEVVNFFFAKSSMSDVLMGSEYATRFMKKDKLSDDINIVQPDLIL